MHFFIDHNSLPEQDSIDTFGVDGNNPMEKFNITSQFSLVAEAKTFACQSGLMIVQQSVVDDSLVNIILKPTEGLQVPFNSVKYFVYRGVRKDSFIDGTTITPKTGSNTETIARLWETWENYKISSNQPALADPSPQCFGYDNSLADSLNIESIYDNSQDVRPLHVQSGEWIGNFGNEFPIGFEIITDNDKITIDLDYLRAEKTVLDTSGLTGLELKAKREQVLSFIDPAAFFGIHYGVGVKISADNGSEKTTQNKKHDELYSLLINKFATRNTVYLDIRSEHGYSYNFYENYGDSSGNNIKIGNSVITPTAQNYSTNDWAILAINNPVETEKDKSDIKINLRIDDNTKPILFFENTNLISDSNNLHFIDDTKILNGEDEWSKDLSFVFPNTDTGTEKENVAYYIRLNYFRQEYNPASPNTVLKNENYFNSAFCPIDLPNLGNTGIAFQLVSNPENNYLNGTLPNTAKKFGFVANNGAYWDSNRILFYSKAVFAHQTTRESYQDKGIENKLSLNNEHYKISSINRDVNISCISLEENNVPFKSIAISYSKTFITNVKENLLLLGITLEELQSLQNVATTSLRAKHHKYMFLEEISLPTTTYRKFQIKVQGLDENGVRKIVAPQEDVFVTTRDGFCFTSAEFAEYETIDTTTVKYGYDYTVNVATREIIRTEKEDKTHDRFIVMNRQGNVVATKEYNAETITGLNNTKGSDNYLKNGSILLVSNDNVRSEIFEFFAKNTWIEWLTLNGKIKGEEFNYIGTNYIVDEVGILYDKFLEMRKKGTVNEYTHNHTIFTMPPEPTGYDLNRPSEYGTGDHGFAIVHGDDFLQRVYDPIEDVYYRFWKGKYEKEKK